MIGHFAFRFQRKVDNVVIEMNNRGHSPMEPDQFGYADYHNDRAYDDYNRGKNGDYSPESQERRDKERSRDRERRRERRRREREKDEGRDYDERDRDRGASRDRHRSSRHNDSDRRSNDGEVYDYGHGEGFYEEGGYIDHPGHLDDQDYPSRGRSRDHDRPADRDRPPERHAGGNSWMSDQPTHTILLRGLPNNVDEKDIKAELMLFGLPIKDVRLMRRKDTGASRGFAFVEFQNVSDAQRWMEHNQGRLVLLNQHRAYMYYSIPKTGRGGPDAQAHDQRSDWTCIKCGYHNFKRRDHCFKCNIAREESERAKDGDGFDQVGNNPCNTLIFRGLDALTTEENLVAALSRVNATPIKNTKVIRDPVTGTSRSFGFVEYSTLAESSGVLEVLQNMAAPLEVDGKAIIVCYAKNTFSTTLATMKLQNQCLWGAQAQSGSSQFEYDATTGYYYDSKSGQYYNPATGQYYDYSQYYQLTQQASTGTTGNTTNAAAAVAHAAIQQAQAAKNYSKKNGKEETPETTPSESEEYAKYPTPDVSTYQYEESSGYYYDPTTSLYYDPNTQYYYNSTTSTFMYWDGEKQTYLPAPDHDGSSMGPTPPDKPPAPGGPPTDPTSDGQDRTKRGDKKEKVKMAKKIAKDMEKWAKSMNAQKEAFKDGFRKTLTGGSSQKERESATADAGFTVLEMAKTDRGNPYKTKREDKTLMPPPPILSGAAPEPDKPDLVASYGGDSDDDDASGGGADDGDEDRLLDWTKMACLLCKRQFPSKEALQRHQQLSDLHKTNLENFRKTKGPDSSVSYRDRAKERRQKYGKP